MEEGWIVILTAAATLISAASDANYPLTWLRHPWVVFSGAMSYAIFLVHMPFLACVRKLYPLLGIVEGSTGEDVLLLSLIPVMLFTSALTYLWIELPLGRWTLRQLSRSVPSSVAPRSPTAAGRFRSSLAAARGHSTCAALAMCSFPRVLQLHEHARRAEQAGEALSRSRRMGFQNTLRVERSGKRTRRGAACGPPIRRVLATQA